MARHTSPPRGSSAERTLVHGDLPTAMKTPKWRDCCPRLHRPTDLHAALDELFAGNADVADALRAQIRDSLSDLPPDLAAMLVIAERHGMATSHQEHIDKVLKERRRTDTASVRRRANQLAEWGIAPKIPQDITAPKPKRLPPQTEVKRVATVKVTEHQDRRKRELGDEGESWALAAIIAQFMSLSGRTAARRSTM